jgi:hypothetical protein
MSYKGSTEMDNLQSHLKQLTESKDKPLKTSSRPPLSPLNFSEGENDPLVRELTRVRERLKFVLETVTRETNPVTSDAHQKIEHALADCTFSLETLLGRTRTNGGVGRGSSGGGNTILSENPTSSFLTTSTSPSPSPFVSETVPVPVPLSHSGPPTIVSQRPPTLARSKTASSPSGAPGLLVRRSDQMSPGSPTVLHRPPNMPPPPLHKLAGQQ